MGYTHYWGHGDIDALAWARLVRDARRIINGAGVDLADYDGFRKPILNADKIALNGVAPDDDYESLVIGPRGTDYDYCKTGHRPYDVVVTAILLRAALTIEGFVISSDGSWDDWKPARDLYARLFGPAPDESPFKRGVR